MKMQRRYFIGSSLDDLELFEEQLEAAGISVPQIHVLSGDDTEVANHQHLHEVQSFMKRDVVHATMQGAVVGIGLSVLLFLLAYGFELTNTAAGWMPFVFLSVVMLGFCTWEGGFIGIQKPNYKFVRFEKVLAEGRHVFFVDLEPGQQDVLEKTLRLHPDLELAGSEDSSPHWLVSLQRKVGMVRHS